MQTNSPDDPAPPADPSTPADEPTADASRQPAPAPDDHTSTRIGVAVSGGGHRAASWGFGALLALVDAGRNRDVVSIASVSGGSIANGVVAQRLDYQAADTDAYESAIRDALDNIANEGLFFNGPSTNRYIGWLFTTLGLAVAGLIAALIGLALAGRDVDAVWWLLAGPVLFAVLWVAWLRKAKLGRWTGLVFALLLLLPSAFCFGAVALVRNRSGWALAACVAGLVLVAVALWWLALKTFSRRSEVVDRGFAEEHFTSPDGHRTLLREVDRPVHHLFCATELQAGDHAYFSPRLVYSYRVGIGTPGDLPLSTAVQASSCFPGGMVPREIPTAQFHPQRPWKVEDEQPPGIPEQIVVNDGGVYDNMGDQWEQGFDDRLERVGDLKQEGATHLIVVNAGKSLGWGTMGRTGLLNREIRGLTRTVGILYDVTTSHRRQGIVRRFRDTETIGRGLQGALVHIAQSPFDIPHAFGHSHDGATKQRAADALALLERLGVSEDDWIRRAAANAQVKTSLRAITGQAVDLLEHSYLLATINLYVIHGWGDVERPERFARARFEALCAPIQDGGA